MNECKPLPHGELSLEHERGAAEPGGVRQDVAAQAEIESKV